MVVNLWSHTCFLTILGLLVAKTIPEGNSFATTCEHRVSTSLTRDTSAVPDIAIDALRVLV